MNGLLQKLMLSGSTAALVAVMSVSDAKAQTDSTQGNNTNDIEQVVVSASRITIAGYTQPTPVSVVGAAQLAQDAYSDIMDSVRNLPAVSAPPSSFSTTQSAASTGSIGTNYFNLRDLGDTRTLVLFDGQRVVQSQLLGGVDVTTFPAMLVSRVDIVTGGASATWGSDAVAGVVNFVLNRNFTGFKATVQGGDTTVGSFQDYSLDSAWGADILGGRGHIEVAIDANMRPDTVLLTDANWFKGAYWVSNPAYVAGSSQPQLIVATNAGPADTTPGGIINSNPAGTVAGSANVLRGIEFVGAGTPQLVNYGNVTSGTLSNGGSLTDRNGMESWETLANPGNTYHFFAFGRYKLTDTIQASMQLNYGYYTGKGVSNGLLSSAVVIHSDNAFIPASVSATMQADGITSFTLGTQSSNNYNNYTATGANLFSQAEDASGPLVSFAHRNLIRGVFSLEGTIGDDWSWNAYIQHSETRFNSHDLGNAVSANLAAAQDAITVTTANRGTSGLPVGSIACRSTLTGAAVVSGNVTAQPGCIPLDVFGTGDASQAAIAYITGTSTNSLDFDHQSLQQDVAEGSMQGTLPWQLPAGKIAVAFGVGWRHEYEFANVAPIAALAGYAESNFATLPSVGYDVLEGFAEVDAPILKDNIVNSLDFSMAGRMTSYSTSGLVETWKLGLTSQVNDDIRLRTTWSVDIRAPMLSELYSPGSNSNNTERDPRTQLNVTARTYQPGNPCLVPEVARTISGGVVMTPTFLEGFTISADWYSISLTSEIARLGANTILDQCNPQLASTIHPGQNGNLSDPLCTYLTFNGPGGALSQITVPTVNLASVTTSGLDLQANYTMDFWEGSLAWSAMANYMDEFTITEPGLGINDEAGSNESPATGNTAGGQNPFGPKWRGTLATTYTAGSYTVTVQTRWFGTGVTQQNGNTGDLASAATANLYEQAYFEIPFTAYLDLRASYKWNDNITFYSAIDNVTDVPPPLVAPTTADVQGGSTEYLNTNPAVYDMLGRNIRVGVRFNY